MLTEFEKENLKNAVRVAVEFLVIGLNAVLSAYLKEKRGK